MFCLKHMQDANKNPKYTRMGFVIRIWIADCQSQAFKKNNEKKNLPAQDDIGWG